MILHNENGVARLLLDAGHGEYLPHAAGLTVTDLFAPMDLDLEPWEDERIVAALRMRLPEGAEGYEPYDPTWCLVVTIEDTRGALAAAWEALLGAVACCPSGDDDTFDYWPSGARLALEMAADIDALEEGIDDRQGAARRVIEGVLGELGELADELRYKIPALEGER